MFQIIELKIGLILIVKICLKVLTFLNYYFKSFIIIVIFVFNNFA